MELGCSLPCWQKSVPFFLSWNRSMPSISFHPISLRSILISSVILFSIFQVDSFQQNTGRISFPLCTCHMSRPSHPPSCDNIKRVRWGLQTMNLHTSHFSPVSCHFLPLKPKCLPQYPTAEHTQPVALPHCKRPRFTPTTKYRTNFFIY